MSDENTIIVEPISSQMTGNWQPIVGEELTEFLDHAAPKDSIGKLRKDAITILSKGIPPSQIEGSETGMVTGYVQSGKTLSFESVIAAAKDNGFPIQIVITGVSNPLLNQSSNRLRKDLQLENSEKRRWIIKINPTDNQENIQQIKNIIDNWQDPNVPKKLKKTLLIPVLKYHGHLQSLTALLSRINLKGIPVLVIDDEADQASLNHLVNRGEESTTYLRISELRDAIPLHTYLMYTATPQAPLFINIVDHLSPNFIHVLDPGPNYTGGLDFFSNQGAVRIIPPLDIPSADNHLDEPPDSLLEALRIFILGVASGLLKELNGNRSMLVHPSHLTTDHHEYDLWVREIVDRWRNTISLSDNEPDRINLIEDFQSSYEELQTTTDNSLESFESLSKFLKITFREIGIQEVNAREGDTPEIEWSNFYGWILVGGKAMDRGFTVEGLTVTYMPRGVGAGNADTIQQRARFFGYKRDYLGFCRVYLEMGTEQAYSNYIEHEENMRVQLTRIQNDNIPLDEWKRAFFFDPRLRPCRRQVHELGYSRGSFSDRWNWPKMVRSLDNRELVSNFTNDLKFLDSPGHPDRTEFQKHSVCRGMSLNKVMNEFLVNLKIFDPSDAERHIGMMLQLQNAIEVNLEETCTIYLISPNLSQRRRRSINSEGKISSERALFQGKSPRSATHSEGEIYLGDVSIRDDENITIQLHNLDLTENNTTILKNVPIVAVWIPSRLAKNWLVQAQIT